MSSLGVTSSRAVVGPWARDLLPSMVLTIVLAFAISRTVDAAADTFLFLVLVGATAVALATTGLHVSERTDEAAPEAPEPFSPPTQGLARQAGQSAARPTSRAKPLTPWAPSLAAAPTGESMSMTIPKLGNAAHENEDAYALDTGTGRFVVADGASSGFASRDWSRALCDVFLTDGSAISTHESFEAAVARAAGLWKTAVTPTGDVPWWAQEGMQRGSFATLLVVDIATIGTKQRWRAAAVGDSCFVQLRRSGQAWTIVTSFPVEPQASFSSYPDLIRTNADSPTNGLTWAEGEFRPGDALLLATDAVSEWLLGVGGQRAAHVLAEATAQQMDTEFCRLRKEHTMVNDDCTVIRLIADNPLLR